MVYLVFWLKLCTHSIILNCDIADLLVDIKRHIFSPLRGAKSLSGRSIATSAYDPFPAVYLGKTY